MILSRWQQNSARILTTLLINTTDKNQHTTFRCQQADILFTSEPRVQSDVNKMSACWHRNDVCWFLSVVLIS